MKKYAVIDFSRTSLSLLVATKEMSRIEIVFKTYRPILIGDMVNKKEKITEKGILKIISEAKELIESAESLAADEVYGISTTLLRSIQNEDEVKDRIYADNENYVGALRDKAEAGRVVTKGDYVVLVIAGDETVVEDEGVEKAYEPVDAAIDEAFK